MKISKKSGNEHVAVARAKNLSISTKHSVEISNFIRYKSTSFAKSFLTDVVSLKKPVPFKKYIRDTGHKAGMAAGRFPVKAAGEMIRLIKSVEANAQSKGLDVENLKIQTVIVNKASIPMTGGRSRAGTKRTHLEMSVVEFKIKKQNKNVASKKGTKTESKNPKNEKLKDEGKVENKEDTKSDVKKNVEGDTTVKKENVEISNDKQEKQEVGAK